MVKGKRSATRPDAAPKKRTKPRGKPSPAVSEADQAKAVLLHGRGMPGSIIARELGCSKRTIHRIITRLKKQTPADFEFLVESGRNMAAAQVLDELTDLMPRFPREKMKDLPPDRYAQTLASLGRVFRDVRKETLPAAPVFAPSLAIHVGPRVTIDEWNTKFIDGGPPSPAPLPEGER